MPLERRLAARLLLAAIAATAATLIVPAWLGGETGAGLWGLEGGTRWDDTGLDLDMYVFGYAAFVLGWAAVFQALGALGNPASARRASTMMIVTGILMVAFVARWFLETNPELSWATFLGPPAAFGSAFLLRTRYSS